MNTNMIDRTLHSTSYWGSLPSNPGEKDSVIDAVATQAIDLIANASAVLRQLNAAFFPGPQPVAFSAVGTTTDFGLFQAVIAAKNAASSFFASKDLNDEAGQVISGSDFASRVSHGIACAAYWPIHFLDIANREFNAMSSLSYLTPYLTVVGDFGFAFLFFFVGILGIRSCWETSTFITELDNALKEVESGNLEDLQALIGKMTGQAPAPTDKKISERDLYVHLGQQLRALLDEIDPGLAAKAWDSDLGKQLFADEKYKNLLPALLSRMGIITDNKTFESLQTNPTVIQKVWAKEQKFIYDRILGSQGAERVQSAKEMHLYELISEKETEGYGVEVAKKLLATLRDCSKKERCRMIIYTISGVVGAVFTLLASAANPAYAVVWNTGVLISYIGIAIGDFLGLQKAFASEGPIGSYSKYYIIFNFVLGLIAFASAIAFTVTTGGIFPIAVIVIVGLVWLMMDAYALYLAHEKEKAYKAEHPTLEMFLDRIKKEGSLNITLEEMEKDHPLKMFHKLPKVQREALLASIYDSLRSVAPNFLDQLDTLIPSQKNEASEGKRLYEKGVLPSQNKALAKRAFKQANKVLLENLDGKKKLKIDNLDTHENSDLFYKAFYSELVKQEQRKLFRKAGNHRIIKAVEKVNQDRLSTLAYFQGGEPDQSEAKVKSPYKRSRTYSSLSKEGSETCKKSSTVEKVVISGKNFTKRKFKAS